MIKTQYNTYIFNEAFVEHDEDGIGFSCLASKGDIVIDTIPDSPLAMLVFVSNHSDMISIARIDFEKSASRATFELKEIRS